ncbi:MAG: 4Fe-4S dicluster domain-containing protein [Planctomycetota bacterium]
MKTVFISELKPFLDALAEQMELYVPKKADEHYVFSKYDPSAQTEVEFNNIRACTPLKEFLFPLRELAAVFPESVEPEQIKPFAVFGLKDCDLRSLEILDKVFLEEEFEDPFYVRRRENMFMISSDCFNPAESCLCNVFDGKPFATSGFDLNLSKVRDGFNEERTKTQEQLEQQNAELSFDVPVRDVVESSEESDVYDVEAKTCIECQACTRICPTCHCFYLYDTSQKDYFAKMKMWDGCMRLAYAEVAGGANPHKMLGDRLKHRLMHKFVYFLDRYGINMCVGCGRCVDAEAGGVDLRVVLKKLSDELKDKEKAKVAK